MPDIFDVARAAEVSVGTVSRVINNHPSVRPSTRRVVFQAMAELGYLPNATARGLRKSKSQTIGVVVPDMINPNVHAAVSGLAGVIRANKYSLLLCDFNGEQEALSAHLRTLVERRVDGIIMLAVDGESCPEVELLVRAGTPVVFMSPYSAPPGTTTMHWDLGQTIRLGLEYLLELGHRQIGFVAFKTLQGFRPPLDTYSEYLLARGAEVDPSLEVLVTSGPECYDAVAAMLSRPERPSALLVGRHLLAPYALGAIYAAGLTIPRDLSFVTIGDSTWAEFYQPPLTAVPRDLAKAGRMAAEHVLARLAGEETPDRLEVPDGELIIRESCARLPESAARCK